MIPHLLASAVWVNVSIGLIVLVLLLAIAALLKPAQQGPLITVAVLLLAVALLVARAP